MLELQNRIMSLINSGQLQNAREECLKACNENPQNAQLWFMLSAVCGQAQDFPAAEEYCLRALEINDNVPSAYYNLAIAQRGQGKTDIAYASLQKATQLQSDFTAAQYELGNISLEKKDYSNAITFYEQVLKSAPDAFQAYTGIAIAQELLGQPELAISACLESLRINGTQQDVLLKLAGLYDKQNQAESALKYYKRAVEQGCNTVDVFINLARMQTLLGNYSDAENCYKKALSIEPSSIEALSNLAMLLEEQRKSGSAIGYIKKAHLLDTENEIVAYNYAKVLTSLRQYSEAESLYEDILLKNPEFSEAALNLGNLYLLSGKANEAQITYQQICSTKPDFHDACSNMLMSLNYTERLPDTEIFNRHRLWAENLENNVDRLPVIPKNRQESVSLKVGYISPDFRSHSVAYFFEGILKNSDKKKITSYCYSDVKNKDAVTERFEKYTDFWRDISEFDDIAVAEMIQKDGIDVLIDLCGHVSNNRLAVFARKPAATQITYLGYPNTTGLSRIDYRIVDNNTDPVDADIMMTEEPLYMEPCFLSYTPYMDCPDIGLLPALSNGYITFGSFNNLAKITDAVIEVWSRILLATPDSVLCIKARQFEDTRIKQSYVERFTSFGIDDTRIQFLTYSDTTSEHLATYNSIDIALDTFPYNGTTTSFEALWMGVPVICLSGSRHASRVGASILKTLSMEELLANNEKEYIGLASSLAKDFETLSTLREQLRARMNASPLLDTHTFVKQFESLLLDINK